MAISGLIAKVDRFRVYNSVVAQIKGLIESGQLVPGDKLPPEPELIRRLGTSRATLREACRVLEHMGLIESRLGKGRFVTSRFEPNPLRLAGPDAVQESYLLDFLQVRRVLETAFVREAAIKAGQNDIERLRRALSMSVEGERDFFAADMEFHLAVAAASGNAVVKHFLSSQAFQTYLSTTLSAPLPGRAASTAEEHERIFTTIRDHDADGAQQAMQEHVDKSEDRLRKALRWRRDTGVAAISRSKPPSP